MGSQTRYEFGIQFGEFYWKFFELKTNPVSKDAYWILSIPDAAIHLSIHSPKPPMYPNWHLHWRSKPLGIDEDVYEGSFSSENCISWAREWLESFRYCEPSDDENVTVFPFLIDAQKTETLGRKERTAIDVGTFMQTMCDGAFYRTKVKRLPLLLKEKFYGNMNVCAFSEDGIILPVDSETMVRFDPRKINIDGLMRSSLGSIFNPIEKALATVQRVNPSSVQRWFPSLYIEDFLEEATSLKHYKPRIIDF